MIKGTRRSFWSGMLRGAVTLLAVLALSAPAFAQEGVVVAAGAGYKKMVNALAQAYTDETGKPVERMFGNMAQVIGQAKTSGKIDLVIGAEFFIDKGALDLKASHELGRGHLVIAWPKGGAYASPDDLLSPKVKSIALPDSRKAIYGKAAMEWLRNTGLYDKVKDKLVEVATVPQVFSYLAADEVDLGFLNQTHAMNVRDALGGYALADEDKYDPIRIIACELADAPHADAAADFVRFLGSDKARGIIKANGL